MGIVHTYAGGWSGDRYPAVGPLFGIDGEGKSFDILTIDIHTIEEGKIVRTYHVEDWTGALRQLKAK